LSEFKLVVGFQSKEDIKKTKFATLCFIRWHLLVIFFIFEILSSWVQNIIVIFTSILHFFKAVNFKHLCVETLIEIKHVFYTENLLKDYVFHNKYLVHCLLVDIQVHLVE
jgi:hypothetical protein